MLGSCERQRVDEFSKRTFPLAGLRSYQSIVHSLTLVATTVSSSPDGIAASAASLFVVVTVSKTRPRVPALRAAHFPGSASPLSHGDPPPNRQGRRTSRRTRSRPSDAATR